MRRAGRALLLFGAALALAACASAVDIWSGLAPGADLGGYATFEPIDPAPPPGANSVIFEQARQGVEAWIESKGYEKEREGDMVALLTFSARDRLQVYGWDRAGCFEWRCAPGYVTSYYTVDTIAVDLIDARTGKALWRGQAVLEVDPASPDPARYEAAVGRLMERLPVSVAPPRRHVAPASITRNTRSR